MYIFTTEPAPLRSCPKCDDDCGQWGTGSKTVSQTEPPYLHDHLATVGLDHIHVLWLEDVRLLVVYCQLLTSVKLMEVPVKNWICINHYICWITNTMRTLFTYFNTPPYSCIYKLCNTVAVQCRQFTSRLLVLLNLLYTRGGKGVYE